MPGERISEQVDLADPVSIEARKAGPGLARDRSNCRAGITVFNEDPIRCIENLVRPASNFGRRSFSVFDDAPSSMPAAPLDSPKQMDTVVSICCLPLFNQLGSRLQWHAFSFRQEHGTTI